LNLEETAIKYDKRAEKLSEEDECALSKDVKSEEKASEDRVEFLLSEGITNDEAGKQAEALQLYLQGVEYCLKFAKETKDSTAQNRFRSLATIALERAEHIKKLLARDNLPQFPEVPQDNLENADIDRDDATNFEPAATPSTSVSAKSSQLDPTERKVLAITSKINNLSFVPFLKSDLNERFAYPVPFR
jgi:hypothetical protein